jgi:hypothetical protein
MLIAGFGIACRPLFIFVCNDFIVCRLYSTDSRHLVAGLNFNLGSLICRFKEYADLGIWIFILQVSKL